MRKLGQTCPPAAAAEREKLILTLCICLCFCIFYFVFVLLYLCLVLYLFFCICLWFCRCSFVFVFGIVVVLLYLSLVLYLSFCICLWFCICSFVFVFVSPIGSNVQGRRSVVQVKRVNTLVDQKNLSQQLLRLHSVNNLIATIALIMTPKARSQFPLHTELDQKNLETMDKSLPFHLFKLFLSASKLRAACLQHYQG